MLSVNRQYSSSDSPLNANTGTPALAMAAAAWSCVEKMLQLAQRTDAPSSISVSMSTAVSMVMWSEPEMRTPLSGFGRAVFGADGHEAGHFLLGHFNFAPAQVGEREVADVVIGCFCVNFFAFSHKSEISFRLKG